MRLDPCTDVPSTPTAHHPFSPWPCRPDLLVVILTPQHPYCLEREHCDGARPFIPGCVVSPIRHSFARSPTETADPASSGPSRAHHRLDARHVTEFTPGLSSEELGCRTPRTHSKPRLARLSASAGGNRGLEEGLIYALCSCSVGAKSTASHDGS